MMKSIRHIPRGSIVKALIAFALAIGATLGASAQLSAPKPLCSQGSFSGYITLRWSAVTDAVAYLIKRSTANDYNSAVEIYLTGNTSITDDYRIKPGQKYYYWVCPVDSNDTYWPNSAAVGTGSAKALTAAMLKITASDGTSTAAVVLKFKKVPEAQVYGIWRSPTSSYDDGELIGSVVNDGRASWTVNDNTATPGKKYYYWLLVLTGADDEFDGYLMHFDKAKDLGWRRIVLQLYTPYSMALNKVQNGTIYCWTLRRNGTSVAASKVAATCSPKKCASVVRFSTPDDEGFSGEFAPKKAGKVNFSAKNGSLTVKSKNVAIIKSDVLVSTVYGK